MKKYDAINEILIQRRSSVFLKKSTTPNPVKEKHIVALMADISQLGYTLSEEVLTVLKTLKKDDLKYFHDTTIKSLTKMLGSSVYYRPLFSNFPDGIPDQYEYLFDRITESIRNLSYPLNDNNESPYQVLSCGHVINNNVFNMKDFGACPICQFSVDDTLPSSDLRSKLKEVTPLKIISLVEKEEIYKVFQNLLSSPVALSEKDYEDIHLIMEYGKESKIIESIPEITNKEILAKFVIALSEHFSEEVSLTFLSDKKLTATDILRIVFGMCDGDVSLATQVKFRSFKQRERRMILSLLDKVQYPEEDMIRYPESWKRLGEKIHPGDFAKRFNNAYRAFSVIRQDPNSIETFNSKYEKAFANKDLVSAIEVLSTRPGEFIRRLDHMIRIANKEQYPLILNALKDIVKDVKTNTLLSVEAHFKNRTRAEEYRFFMPKGSMAKLKIFDASSKTVSGYIPLKKEVINEISNIIFSELKVRFSEKGELKNVFIDPSLKTCLVPTVRRNASKSLHSVARGSTLSLGNEKARTVRLFIYWKGMIDLDLSVGCYDKDFKNIGQVYYGNLKNEGITHSGDIQSAPNGASEFIDFDIDICKEKGIRYMLMSVISFSGDNFAEFESFAGVMKREKPSSGEIYEPKTVQHRFEFEGTANTVIPLIFDLETESFLYCDISMSRGSHSNVYTNDTAFLDTLKVIKEFVNTKPNLYDLFELHALGRGAIIDTVFDSEKEYDGVFGIDKGITPFDIDIINAEWI